MPRRTPRPITYELDLLENGLDFLKSGIDLFYRRSTPSPRSHKYALLHIFSGLLLLLKERLARIRPSLVFVHESEAGLPGAKTTDYHKTLGRLEANGVRVDPGKRVVLDEIRDLRNAVEHYRVDLSLERTEAIIGEMVSFLYNFCRDELSVDIDRHLSRRALERFYDLKEIGDRLYADAEESANADAEADDAYFRGFARQYAAMEPSELLEHAAGLDSIRVQDLQMRECPSCRNRSLLLLEVGACVSPDCRSTPRLGICHCCQDVAFNGAYTCEACRYG